MLQECAAWCERSCSIANMCDQKNDKLLITQKVMIMFGWEKPHKGKGYKYWAFSDWEEVAHEHKYDNDFMTMMSKRVRGTKARKTWLKDRKDLMKILQARAHLDF